MLFDPGKIFVFQRVEDMGWGLESQLLLRRANGLLGMGMRDAADVIYCLKRTGVSGLWIASFQSTFPPFINCRTDGLSRSNGRRMAILPGPEFGTAVHAFGISNQPVE